MSYKLFWGDLHNHCSISYGHGTLPQALARARQQLDFCSVTGHAFWPDMPTDRNQYAEIIDYHNEGFATCAKNWNVLVRLHEQANEDGSFVAFPSYEWHSLKYGDHIVYSSHKDLPLKDAPDLPGLRAVAKQVDGIAIPHHIGYAKGFRGINWDEYREDVSPFVEMYSLHGCSLSTHAAYPMLHDMGPRDFGSTAEAGWQKGYKFGIVGGTDHHAAYPGSHGDGRMGVFADSLTREGLMDAFKARRVFAATGDKIDARFHINDAWIGDTIKASGKRNLKLSVEGIDQLDHVRLIKNGRVYRRFFPDTNQDSENIYRLRLTWGWGKKIDLVYWLAKLQLSDGEFRKLDTCFSGHAVVAPKKEEDDLNADTDYELLPHEILDRTDKSITWKSVTSGNLSMRHATTQSISLEIKASLNAKISLEVNGHKFSHTLAGLIGEAQSHFMRGWLTEAMQIGPAVPKSECCVSAELLDDPENDSDIYRLEAAQANGQWVWLTPIWIER
tara:strand:+ start:9636 stop:11135 length:1500 start_codon:yes stop_codon:yes gene_type:complete